MPSSLFDLAGQVALVTGGNGGIGRAIALRLAEAGAAVAIWGRNEAKNKAVLAELEGQGGKGLAMEVDVADFEKLSSAFVRVEEELGPLSILVNNAGILFGSTPMNLKPGDLHRVLDTNLVAPLLLCQLAGQSMMRGQAGKIVNVASAAIAFGNPRPTAYAISKAALVQLTKALAVELAPHNIQVNAVAPGLVDTEMIAGVKEQPELHAYGISRTPLGRWATPDEIAGAVVYYTSPASSFTTGTTLFIDGGYTIKQ